MDFIRDNYRGGPSKTVLHWCGGSPPSTLPYSKTVRICASKGEECEPEDV
jgi:hypothetical protein